MTARIWIGGQLKRRKCKSLVTAVRTGNVSTGSPGWEDLLCRPVSIEGLLEARQKNGVLHLQHGHTLTTIVEACHRAGLTYRLWISDDDGVTAVEGWTPGMDASSRFHGHPTDPDLELVDAAVVRRAIKLLRRSKACMAKHELEAACPELPEVPPLELVDG